MRLAAWSDDPSTPAEYSATCNGTAGAWAGGGRAVSCRRATRASADHLGEHERRAQVAALRVGAQDGHLARWRPGRDLRSLLDDDLTSRPAPRARQSRGARPHGVQIPGAHDLGALVFEVVDRLTAPPNQKVYLAAVGHEHDGRSGGTAAAAAAGGGAAGRRVLK